MTATQHNRYHSWRWIPTLFVAEEIPLVLVSYLSLLAFFQLGSSWTSCTILSALLMMPWALKSFFRLKIKQAGNYRIYLLVCEFLLFIALLSVAMSLSSYSRTRVIGIFVSFFVVSALSAWHSSLSRMYYEQVLYPREQRLYAGIKRTSSQLTMIVAYGLLIMLVGFLEVFFRSFTRAWSMAGYLLAGGMLFLLVCNLLLTKETAVPMPAFASTVNQSFRNEGQLIGHICRQPHFLRIMSALFVLLLPFSLMFYPRVFFLLTLEENGGLGCSLQDVGFAQGTIGVTALMLGGSLGLYFMRHTSFHRLYFPFVVALTIPSLFYFLMSQYPQPGNMYALCTMTGLTQFCFGIGLNVCRPFIRYVSCERHRGSATLLYLPLIVSHTMLPMALSGWLLRSLGIHTYFILLLLVTLLALCMAYVNRRLLMNVFLSGSAVSAV